jgi:hypothetical protein
VQFQHILRLLNTNVDGRRKIMYALTEIKGVGRRYANIVCKKADVDLKKRWEPALLLAVGAAFGKDERRARVDVREQGGRLDERIGWGGSELAWRGASLTLP